MRVVAIAGAVALVCSLGFWTLVGTSGAEHEAPSGAVPAQVLAELSDRVARLEAEPTEPPSLAGVEPASHRDLEKIRSAIADLEARLAAVEESRRSPTNIDALRPEKKPIPDGQLELRHRLEIDRARAKIATLPTLERQRRLYDLAMVERKAGWHESEESLLREVVNTAGPESELGKEAAYQIGWARSGRLDHAGAREAWLLSSSHYDMEHWRRAHARFNAANAAVKMHRSDVARGELEDLVRDLEDRAEGEPRLESALIRARDLLIKMDG